MTPAEQIRASATALLRNAEQHECALCEVEARTLLTALDALEAEHVDRVEFTRDEANLIATCISTSRALGAPRLETLVRDRVALLDERIGDKP